MANEQKNQEEERPDVHYIPDNFMNSGRILNGMIETRNALEAAAIGGALAFIEWLLMMNMSSIKMFAIMVITIGPIVIVGIVGVNGDSLSQFTLLIINFLKNKRKLRYRRIMKNAKTSGSRAKSRPANSKKKTSRTSS
jgi:hypothetical protein